MSKNDRTPPDSNRNNDLDMPISRDPGIMVVNESTPLLTSNSTENGTGAVLAESSNTYDDCEFRSSPSSVNYERELSMPKLPLRYQRHGILISSTACLMTFIRSNIGAGSLTLPIAFKQSGLWMGLALAPLFALLNTVFSLILVECSQEMCKRCGVQALSYGRLAKKACDVGPPRFRKHGKKFLYLVNATNAISQLGVTSFQMLYVSETVLGFMKYLECPWQPSPQIFLSATLPLYILVNAIPSLNVLSYMSTVGNVLFIGGFIAVMQFIVQPPYQYNLVPAVGNGIDFCLFLGTIMYTFEGQTFLLPLENTMKNPKEFVGWNGVLVTGMAVIGSIFIATGFFGYAKFGDEIAQTMSSNMPNTDLYQSVNFLQAVAVILGWPVQVFVIGQMFWDPLTRKFIENRENWMRYHQWLEQLFRLGLVLLSYLIVIAIPFIDLLVALNGISLGLWIAFVYPAIIQIFVYWEVWSPADRKFYTIRNLLIAGFVGLISIVFSVLTVYIVVIRS